ncbi:MAG: single-stranded DNA-binding protein [Oscillospiraceae bacterium]
MENPCFDQNEIVLRGTVLELPRRSHESHGEVFYGFPLSLRRLSGVEDVVNVMVPDRLLELSPLAKGDSASLTGEIRTYNNRSGVGSRLVITVYAHTLLLESGDPVNTLHLKGTVCRVPTLRRTPLGREICDLLLAVNRKYSRSDYLPCIAWGYLAHRCESAKVGDRLSLTGRLQSRLYVKETDHGSEERTAYEVSIMELPD